MTDTDTNIQHLIGTDDEPGLLDEYKVEAIVTDGNALIVWRCPRGHGDDLTGHLGLIARNMDGDQSGLTLGELVRAATEHESEAH